MRKKSLKALHKWEICDVLFKMGLDSEVVNSIGFKMDTIYYVFEYLRDGNEIKLDDDVQAVLEIMEGRWGYRFDRPSEFKTIKRTDEEGNTYVRIEWL